MSQPTRILIALVVGLVLGIAGARMGWGIGGLGVADTVGELWLAGLQMTIVPLVVALLVTGIAQTADSARGGRIALRSVLVFLVFIWISAILSALLMPALLEAWPMPQAAADALRGTMGAAVKVEAPPPISQFILSIVPTNPLSAAVTDSFLPLIVFTTLFGLAVTQIAPAQRAQVAGFFSGVTDAMLIMVGWVLWIAPIGVFALAYAVGVRAGTSAIGALLHYILTVSAMGVVVWALAYPLARFGGKVPLGRFVRAIAPAQAVALSTQSSLACLPPMLKSSERLGVSETVRDVTLPLAVAIFRATGPAMNLAVAIYIAHWFGIPLEPGMLFAGVVVAATTTLGSVSLPGQISFFTAIAPIAVAMGVPLEPLALLVAVEMIPDLIRTIGNVTMDVAATTTVARLSGEDQEADAAEVVAPAHP